MLENTTSAAGSLRDSERSHLVADLLRPDRRLPHDRLAHDRTQTVRIRVRGESMLPTLWPGDVVEIVSCSPQDVRPGEVVLALREGRLFLHRLVAPCTASGFHLRGDSMPGLDPWFPSEALLGRLMSRSRKGRGILAKALSRAVGLFFCHFGPARRLALKIHAFRKASALQFRNSESMVELGIQ